LIWHFIMSRFKKVFLKELSRCTRLMIKNEISIFSRIFYQQYNAYKQVCEIQLNLSDPKRVKHKKCYFIFIFLDLLVLVVFMYLFWSFFSSQGINLTNILQADVFVQKCFFAAFLLLQFGFVFLAQRNLHKNCP